MEKKNKKFYKMPNKKKNKYFSEDSSAGFGDPWESNGSAKQPDMDSNAAASNIKSLAPSIHRVVEFLIIGTMKGGSTAAVVNLRKHPDVFIPRIEMHFFNKNELYRRGIKWYRKHFQYKYKVVGDKTPLYSYILHSHSRMHHHAPQAKLFFFLRNPVNRAYSQWNMMKQRGWIRQSFEQIIQRDLNNMKNSNKNRSSRDVIQRGFYMEQIKSLLKYYPREQLYICISEKCMRDPITEYHKMFTYLGIPPIDIKYRAGQVRSYKEPMKETTKNKLYQVYQSQNEELFQFLGYRIPEWEQREDTRPIKRLSLKQQQTT